MCITKSVTHWGNRSMAKVLNMITVSLSILPLPHQCLLPVSLTCAVLGCHCIPVVAGGTELAPCAGRVVHAPSAGPRQGVTAAEQHVRICVPTAVTGLARAANHQGIAIVSWGTSGEVRQVRTQSRHEGDPPAYACTMLKLYNYNCASIQHL